MAEYEDVCELEDSVSTISVDSVTISNLAVSNNLPRGNTTQGNSAASEHGSRQKKRVDSIPHDQVTSNFISHFRLSKLPNSNYVDYTFLCVLVKVLATTRHSV